MARLARDDPFEHRSVDVAVEADFDLAAVEEGVDLADAAGRALAERALAGAVDPFAGGAPVTGAR